MPLLMAFICVGLVAGLIDRFSYYIMRLFYATRLWNYISCSSIYMGPV